MANICNSLIKADIAFDCDALSVRGVEDTAIIINRDDIDMVQTTFDTTLKNVITNLQLKAGKKGYQVVQLGATPFNGAKTDLVVGTFRNTYTNELPIAILSNDPTTLANIVEPLNSGAKFVVIIKNKTAGGDEKALYQVYGYAQGLVASAGANEKYSEETDGGWLTTLTETGAPHPALFFYKTSAEATEAAIESLLNEAE